MKTLRAKLMKKTIWNFLGNLSDKLSPVELRKIFSCSRYLTLLIAAVKYGITVTENISKPSANNPTSKLRAIASEINTLITILNQNIRFQKLSLFRRSVSQFLLFVSIALAAKFNTLIVAYYSVKHKLHLLLLVIIASGVSPVFAYSVEQENRQEIQELISAAEERHNIPAGLLYSIAKVESRLKPYALNVEGKTLNFASTTETIQELTELLEEGITNIDVGVMQLNWRWHSQYFSSIEEMLAPSTNIDYAGKLLKSLYEQHGSWQKAVRYYHSATPYHHRKYSRKVIMAWIGG